MAVMIIQVFYSVPVINSVKSEHENKFEIPMKK